MAVDAKRALIEKRSVDRRREIWGRVFVVGCALLLLAGVVVYFQSRSSTDSGPAAAPAKTAPAPAQKPSAVKSGGKLEPAARLAAIDFIRTALAREDLARAWTLASPDLRSAVTKKQWLNGELPFPPFPVRNLETTGFRVVGTSPNEVLLEVLLVPKLNSGYVPTRYEVTLERTGAKAPWKVSYFLPYAPPGIYKEPAA